MSLAVNLKAQALLERRHFDEHKMPEGIAFAQDIIAAAAVERRAPAPRNLMRMGSVLLKSMQEAGALMQNPPKNEEEVRAWLQSRPKELSLVRLLNFSGLGLTEIPREFLELPLHGLLVLSFGENELEELPAGFGRNFPKLQHLYLHGNKLKSLPAFFGAHLPDVTKLDLGGNQIAYLDYRFIDYWKNLEELNLQKNRLPGLMPNFGKNWPKLKVLDLRDNQIRCVPQEVRGRFLWLDDDTALQGNPVQIRKERIIQKAMSCPEIKAVYEKALKNFQFRIRFERPPSGPEGECNVERKAVFVDPDMPDDKVLGILVFELINASEMNSFKSVCVAAIERKIDREEFAKLYEKIEFANCNHHKRIMKWAIEHLGWSPSVQTHDTKNFSFEKLWPYIKTSSHTEFYRTQYDELMRTHKPLAKG